MYLYNFGYYSYEESEYIQLYHEKKFTKEGFEEIIMTSASEIINNCPDKKISFEDIFQEVLEDLTKNRGFIQVEFDAEFSVFGWPDLLDKSSWEGDRDKLLNKLSNFIKTAKS